MATESTTFQNEADHEGAIAADAAKTRDPAPHETEDVVNPNHDPDDPDYAAYLEAQEAVKAESEGKAGEGDDTAAGGDKPADAKPEEGNPQQGKDAQQASDRQQVMIPKERFDEVNARLAKLRDDFIFTQGRLSMYEGQQGQNGQQPGGEKEPSEPTPAERITALQGELKDVAKKLDEGDISYVDFVTDCDF